VRRLLKISVVGAGESVKNAGFFNEHLLMRTFLRGLLVDKAGMEAESRDSDDHIARPPRGSTNGGNSVDGLFAKRATSLSFKQNPNKEMNDDCCNRSK